MEKIRSLLQSLLDLTPRNLVRVIDILLVAFLIYQLLKLLQGTRAWRILIGIIIFLGLLSLSSALHLEELHWVLERMTLLGPVALVILFFPELRHTLENVGGFLPTIVEAAPSTEAATVEELVAAMAELASLSTGALIVVERGAPLDEIAETGVQLDARLSAPLLSSIFFERNALHDGAVIVRGDKVVAAACRLPLSESSRLDKQVHMRHRAAVGISEAADAIALVVSEERGTMSLAIAGELERMTGVKELRERLNLELRGEIAGSQRKPRRFASRKTRAEVEKAQP